MKLETDIFQSFNWRDLRIYWILQKKHPNATSIVEIMFFIVNSKLSFIYINCEKVLAAQVCNSYIQLWGARTFCWNLK